MIRRLVCLLLVLLCAISPCLAEEPAVSFPEPDSAVVYPPEEFEFLKRVYAAGEKKIASYESETVSYLIESFNMEGTKCILTRVWVQDPARQFRKANAEWGAGLANVKDLGRKVKGAVLVTNASGYITKGYPDVPANYPGSPSDYYNTTLGSLVITDGEILRELEGVPFCGLALSEEGISMYRGADNSFVLATNPTQTWAFFEVCAMQENGTDLLPEEKDLVTDKDKELVKMKHARTVLARINRNNYVFLHIPYGTAYRGMNLYRINEFFFEHFDAEWVYNLDGGYSSSLYYCNQPQKKNAALTLVVPHTQKVADVLCITE